MSQLSIFKSVFCILMLAALTISCINVNIPGQSTSTTPPAGNTVTTSEPPTIVTFTASPENLLSGRSGTLSWNVKNADIILITPEIGNVKASGSTTVKPLADTTYTLVASNAAGLTAVPAAIKVVSAGQLQTGPLTIGGGTQQGTTGPGKTIVGSADGTIQDPGKPDLSGTDRQVAGSLTTDLQVIKPDLKVIKGQINQLSLTNCTLDVTLYNAGNAKSGPFFLTLVVDNMLKDSLYVDRILNPGHSAIVTMNYKFTPDPGTGHHVEMFADAGMTIPELDESNNSLVLYIPYY